MAADTHTWSAQVDPPLNEELEELHADLGGSRSETVRHALRNGLNGGVSVTNDRLYARVSLIGAGLFVMLGLLFLGLNDAFGVSTFETGAWGSAAVGGAFLFSWGYSMWRGER